jgi:hypothetical protein
MNLQDRDTKSVINASLEQLARTCVGQLDELLRQVGVNESNAHEFELRHYIHSDWNDWFVLVRNGREVAKVIKQIEMTQRGLCMKMELQILDTPNEGDKVEGD